MQIALSGHADDRLLRLAQLEKELPLRLGGADLQQAPGGDDVVLDIGPDPPDRVGNQTHAFGRVEFAHRHHQPDVPFLDQVEHLYAVGTVLPRNLHHETQVRRYQGVGSLQVAVSA